MVKMWRSGYSHKVRKDVVHGAVSAYECRKRLSEAGVRPMYRSKEYKREEREVEKMMKKETWFRSSTCGIQPETVLFVTATPNSELCNNIKERLRMSKIPVRVA